MALNPALRAAALLACCLAAAAAVGGVGPGQGRSRPHAYPHLQGDLQELRRRCEAQEGEPQCGGLHAAERENCVRRCMSPACYAWQYGSDALEEGEDDSTRGPRYQACVLREVREARAAAAAAAGMPVLQPHRAPGYRRHSRRG